MANSYGMMVPAILATLRKRESGTPQGNYTIRNPNMSASGAYQFIDPTWQRATKQYGIGTEYPRAYMAPPAIQDEIARREVQGLLSKGYGPEAVAKTWYTGNPEGKMSAAAIAANNGLTADKYAANWMRDFSKLSGAGYSNPSQMDTSPGNMAPQGFTPNQAPGLPSLVGSPMPDTSGGVVGDPMAQQQPDYMAQMGKMMGGFGGGGGGGEAPIQAQQIPHWSIIGKPGQNEMQFPHVAPVQITQYGGQKMPMRRRGLLG